MRMKSSLPKSTKTIKKVHNLFTVEFPKELTDRSCAEFWTMRSSPTSIGSNFAANNFQKNFHSTMSNVFFLFWVLSASFYCMKITLASISGQLPVTSGQLPFFLTKPGKSLYIKYQLQNVALVSVASARGQKVSQNYLNLSTGEMIFRPKKRL